MKGTLSFITLTAFVSLFFAACTGDDNKNNDNGDNQNNVQVNNEQNNNHSMQVSKQQCVSTCVTKAQACGAPGAAAQQACANDICPGPITATQNSCIETTDCQTLEQSMMSGNTICNIGSATTLCQSYPSCESGQVVTCSVVNGAEVIEKSQCEANKVCSEGACKQMACIASGKTGCNTQNNPSNCCDDRQTCFGMGDAPAECCAKPGKGCDKDAECCFSDAANSPAKCVDNVCVY